MEEAVELEEVEEAVEAMAAKTEAKGREEEEAEVPRADESNSRKET